MVKIISLTCVFVLLLVSQALALSPINVDVINESQEYGKSKAQNQLDDFLLPWISYEEKASKLNNTVEHAYLYTNFLLIAIDAREKSLNGHKVNLLDSERILADYAGILSFSVVMFGDKQNFAQKSSVIIKQDKKIVKAYQVLIPLESEKVIKDNGQSLFRTQCYFYFFEKDIISDKPVTLSIITGNKKEHNFYFDMGKIK